LTAAQTDVFAFVTGSAKTVSGSLGAATGSGTIDHFVYQIVVDSTAGPGATTQETFTWRFDET
jgi:hypothetical protein